MSLSTDINNHVQLGLADVPEQYKRSPIKIAFLTALLNRVQEIENAFQAVRDTRSLQAGANQAYGAMLDQIGGIVGQPRGPGEGDADYINELIIKIAENNSLGNPETIISLCQTILPGASIAYYENYPATIGITTTIAPSSAAAFKDAVQAALPAGVRFDYLVEVSAPGTAFKFSDQVDGGLGTGVGFADLNDSSIQGGTLGTLL